MHRPWVLAMIRSFSSFTATNWSPLAIRPFFVWPGLTDSAAAKALARYFFEREDVSNDDNALSTIIGSACRTNLTVDTARKYAETIFAYDDFERTDLVYSGSREIDIKRIREADGRYQ